MGYGRVGGGVGWEWGVGCVKRGGSHVSGEGASLFYLLVFRSLSICCCCCLLLTLLLAAAGYSGCTVAHDPSMFLFLFLCVFLIFSRR